jgi:hypothetical protein
MSDNAYQEIHRDREAALRGVHPQIANRPAPSQAFNQGAHDGREAAVSRDLRDTNKPRRE